MVVPRCCTFIAWGTNKIHYSKGSQAVSARSSEDKLRQGRGLESGEGKVMVIGLFG
jgi:hypothetical protein